MNRKEFADALLEHSEKETKTDFNKMNLFDLIQTYCDWSSGEDLFKTIVVNSEKFEASRQVFDIFMNTAKCIL